MADAASRTEKKVQKLPPITSTTRMTEDEKQSVKKKPRKQSTLNKSGNDVASSELSKQNEEKPAPRQRRKRAPSQGDQVTEDEGGQNAQTKAPLPKKKPKKAQPTSAKEDTHQNEELAPERRSGQGSKTSLISKDGKSPRKKTGKKKKKQKKASADDYEESPWADDLRAMTDDIITGEVQDEEEAGDGTAVTETTKRHIPFISAPVLKSQPLDKIFIETSSKFKGQSKTALARMRLEELTGSTVQQEVKRMTTIDFALSTHKIFQVVALFLHGLTAGLALWQMVIVFTLTTFSSDDFLEHYHNIAMPLQASYYFLLVICTISASDRFDLGNPSRRFVLRAVTLQNGAISIVFCLIALILSLVTIRYADRMNLYMDDENLFISDEMKSDEIDTFKGLNAARSVFIILSWFVLSITPNSDRFAQSLKSGETGLEKELEMDRVSSA